jgi:serine protease
VWNQLLTTTPVAIGRSINKVLFPKRIVFVFIAHLNLGLALSVVDAADLAPLPVPSDSVNGLIVKFDAARTANDARMRSTESRGASMSRALSRQSQSTVALSFARTLGTGAELYRFSELKSLAEATALAATASQVKGVSYATPNRIMRTQALPKDSQYGSQWGFRYNASERGANFESAWDVTKGNASQTIGVIDSGVARAHPELISQLRSTPEFPFGGYDFIRSLDLSADGDGRDFNPEQSLNACGHGSHVMGTIAAKTRFVGGGTEPGVAGGAPNSKVLMARGLDFSGEEADIIDAMLWLGGLSVPDVPINPTPTRIINMSLGGSGACGAGYADAVEQLAAVGTVVVAAAGNLSGDVANFAPANCSGVIAVAANTVSGSRAGFSNFGSGVTITAPGDSIFSTGGSNGQNCYKSGTSMAAPHVTAALALAQTVNPALSVSQTILALRASARNFPSGSGCTTSTCGAGLLDARALVDRASPTAAAAVGWTSTPPTARENDGDITLKLARIGSVSVATSVSVQTANASATSGIDFGVPTPSTVTWAVGDSADKTVTIPINYRAGEQGLREFGVSIAPFSGGVATVAPASLPVRITEVDCNATTPIAIGDTVNANLGVVGNTYCRGGVRGPAYNTVRYQFSGNAGDVVTLAMNSTTASPAVLDPYVYLLDSGFRVLAENDDIVAGNLRNSLIEQFALPAAGTYYIDATTWSPSVDNVGTYQLSLIRCGAYRAGTSCDLDVDGDGVFDSKDATFALRRLAGFSGASIELPNAFRACAVRRTGDELAAFVDTQTALQLPSSIRAYDIDGDGLVNVATDGLMLLRVALGMRGDGVVANATAPGAPRRTWVQVSPYLENGCGMVFTP